jgi:hypothetical protein
MPGGENICTLRGESSLHKLIYTVPDGENVSCRRRVAVRMYIARRTYLEKGNVQLVVIMYLVEGCVASQMGRIYLARKMYLAEENVYLVVRM